MSYSISASGHGPKPDDLREAFGDLVRALRAATPEGETFSAMLSDGSGATYQAADVPELEPADDGAADEPEEEENP